MIKAFFKGCWDILSIVLIAIAIIGIIIGYAYIAMATHPIMFLVLVILSFAVVYGAYQAYVYYKQIKDKEYSYEQDLALLDEMKAKGYLPVENYCELKSKIISKREALRRKK
jgi:hypothetical protein